MGNTLFRLLNTQAKDKGERFKDQGQRTEDQGSRCKLKIVGADALIDPPFDRYTVKPFDRYTVMLVSPFGEGDHPHPYPLPSREREFWDFQVTCHSRPERSTELTPKSGIQYFIHFPLDFRLSGNDPDKSELLAIIMPTCLPVRARTQTGRHSGAFYKCINFDGFVKSQISPPLVGGD